MRPLGLAVAMHGRPPIRIAGIPQAIAVTARATAVLQWVRPRVALLPACQLSH